MTRSTGDSIVLRPARPDEAVVVGSTVVAAYDAEGYLVLPDGTRDEHYAAWLADAGPRIEGDTVVVAVLDDQIVGTVTWCPFGSRSSELVTGPGQGEIRALAVAPPARRRGVARALAQWCVDEARRTGLQEVLLSSRDLMSSAHALYVSLGFERDVARDWSPVEGVRLLAFRLTL